MVAARILPIRPEQTIPRLQPLGAADTLAVDAILATVVDPELPMISIADLGILRGGGIAQDESLTIVITPTYSGCPAMRAIRGSIQEALTEHGYPHVKVFAQLSHAWTTDWMSDAGKKALVEQGIAAPLPAACGNPVPDSGLVCHNCSSNNIQLLTEFGSTACKAMYRCTHCLEIFDYFKGF